MSNLKITPIKYAIHAPKAFPLFGDEVIHVTADSQGGGLYYIVEQVNPALKDELSYGNGKMAIEKEEVEAILEVIKELEKMEEKE